jgi:hypothetical protein
MSPVRITGALLEKLGEPAAAELHRVMEVRQLDAKEDVMTLCAERFERRLVEELARLRIEMAQGFGGLRQEMADGRFDLVKWTFVFWVGQVVAIGGIVGLLIRTLPTR